MKFSKSKVMVVSKIGGCDVDVVCMEKEWSKGTALDYLGANAHETGRMKEFSRRAREGERVGVAMRSV